MPVFIKKVPKPVAPSVQNLPLIPAVKKLMVPSKSPVQSIAQAISPVLFSPMLAADSELGKIDYSHGGKIAMPKLNGVRGVNQGGLLMPRSLKHGIRNDHTRNLFSKSALANLDGELVVGDFADENVFVVSTSGVGKVSGTPAVKWHIFDIYHPTMTYRQRLELRDRVVRLSAHPDVLLIPWVIVTNDTQMTEYASWALSMGYEGLVLRDPTATYKEGRSTALEGGFQRYCPWLTSEAIILSIEEGSTNQNESKRNALGFLAKSSHKENKVGSGQAGSFKVQDMKTGIKFSMAVPSDELQKLAHAHPELFIGKPATYKFKPPVKTGGKPRFPQYQGLRDTSDMS